MVFTNRFLLATLLLPSLSFTAPPSAATPASAYVVYQGASGPGAGKHIVFIAGDEEYRSEESLPMLAKILAVRHGFKCTVLFAQDSATGYINPNSLGYLPGLSLLAGADLMVILTRFRELPDADMKFFVDYVNSGKPIIGLRTATHAFQYLKHPDSPYAKYDFQSTVFAGGFGRQVLGQTWVNHWGGHGSQSTRGLIRQAAQTHPILTGVTDIWGPTDVYEAAPFPTNGDEQVLVDGQVLTGMKATDPPLSGKATMPIVWTRSYTGEGGKKARIVTSTIGAAVDFQSEGLRRLLVNACYWGLGMEAAIPAKSNVDYVGDYAPTFFGNDMFKKNVRPQDLALPTVADAPRRPSPKEGKGIIPVMASGWRWHGLDLLGQRL